MMENPTIQKTPVQAVLEMRLGFWSAISATIVSAIFMIVLIYTFVISPIDWDWHGVQSYVPVFARQHWQMLAFVIPCFLIAPSYLIMASCIHRLTPENKKILSLLGVVFAVAYLAQITANYYLQMTAISQSIIAGQLDGVAMFAFGNLNSVFWAMEALGYTWLSISLIFVGLLFKGGWMETAIKWIFVVNGILGAIAPIQAVLQLNTPPISLLLFAVTFPVSTVLIAILFHRAKKTGSMPLV
jgi:hypothetical protein